MMRNGRLGTGSSCCAGASRTGAGTGARAGVGSGFGSGPGAGAGAGALAVRKGIVVRWVTGEKFDRIVKVECGDRPEMTDELMFAIESGPLTTPSGGYPENTDDDELPF